VTGGHSTCRFPGQPRRRRRVRAVSGERAAGLPARRPGGGRDAARAGDLPDGATGRLHRLATTDDEAHAARLGELGRRLFAAARGLAAELALPLVVLDVEVLLDGRRAVVGCLHAAGCDATALAAALAERHGLEVLLEDLAGPAPAEDEHGGCGEPGCGRASGGGCSSCGPGGCSSCGGGKVDMAAYFAHLRTRMEQRHRTPLL
jgi:hypothetical protein